MKKYRYLMKYEKKIACFAGYVNFLVFFNRLKDKK